MVFRHPSDINLQRSMNTPPAAVILQQLDSFLFKWESQTHCGENILPTGAVHELNKLKKHAQKGCLSDIPPSCGTNRNEAMHRTLRKNISRQRIGIQLALALLGVSFFIWNEKRNKNTSGENFRSIQSYYSSFLNSGRSPTKENFGISISERQTMMSVTSDHAEINSDIEISDIEDFFSNDTAVQPTSEDDSDNDNETPYETFLSTGTATQILKTVILKFRLLVNLSSKINTKPKYLAKNVHLMKSALLLLSNSKLGPNVDETLAATKRVESILQGYGLERVQMRKDGNCLFSSISFFIMNALSKGSNCDAKLREHLKSLGLSSNQDLQTTSTCLRKLVVTEFLGANMVEYSSFLLSTEHMSYEEMARYFERDGFFDCELGNAVVLALANVLCTGIIIFTSLENYPVITITPSVEPVTCTAIYIAFEQVGAGHYDAVIERSVAGPTANEDTGVNEGMENSVDPNVSSNPRCRCGKGGAKNKKDRQFCSEYKSGCMCFRSLTGCTNVHVGIFSRQYRPTHACTS